MKLDLVGWWVGREQNPSKMEWERGGRYDALVRQDKMQNAGRKE
jgi:hypothetical protein